jgi:signal transduction histidine kinase
MHYHTVRMILYSSIAIVALTLVWGVRESQVQRRLVEQTLRQSLDQEMVVLNGAVRSSVQALKYRLLDVLKAEGNDHSTRTFQDSQFFAASLLEWDQVQWTSLWYSVKSKSDFQSDKLETWMRSWPLSKLALDEVYVTKVGEVDGQPQFAILVPVRRPNQIPLIGVGIFSAAEFGINFSADEARDLRVFNQEGFLLAYSRPAYLGASVKGEVLAREILEGDEVSLRREWRADNGEKRIGMVSHIPDSNLLISLEARVLPPLNVQAWVYLALTGLGAILLNWVLFNLIFKPLLAQLAQNDQMTEQLRRQLSEQKSAPSTASLLEKAKLPELDFIEPSESTAQPLLELSPEPEVPALIAEDGSSLQKVMQAALRSVHSKLQESKVVLHSNDLSRYAHHSDSMQLQTALEEVLKNAIEAMAGGAVRELHISARQANGRVHLLIEDTGCGIADENLDKVFDPFFSTKDSQGVARGLGLNVVRRVVEELEGTIQLRRRMGGGTCVEIEWPQTARPIEMPQLVMSEVEPRDWPEIAIRRPKVRTLEN